MTNNNLPDFLYFFSERFLTPLPQTMNNLDIYDKIYRDQGGRTVAELPKYNEYDIDDLNNEIFLISII